MANSFRLSPNTAEGGNVLSLFIEGLDDPNAVLGKPCEVRFFEIDENKSKDDLLAVFGSRIIKVPQWPQPRVVKYYFNPDFTTRLDGFSKELPSPQKYKIDDGKIEIPIVANWRVPHFGLSFSSFPRLIANFKRGDFTILITGEPREVERYIYKIGFNVIVNGKEIFSSRDTPTTLDCSHVVTHNCVVAATCYMEAHKHLVDKRRVGTHYGSHYSPPDSAGFKELKAKYNLNPSDCITYVIDTLRLGHREANLSQEFVEIFKTYEQAEPQKKTGVTLAKGLERHGWRGLYFNPSGDNPHYEYYMYQGKKVVIHKDSYRDSHKHKKYHGLVVHDRVVDFSPKDGLTAWVTKENEAKFIRLNQVPFGFIIASAGYHTAILMKGMVYEVHWKHGPGEKTLYEASDFLSQIKSKSLMGSGIILVPRECWRSP